MKTQEEIATLKRCWVSDPSWDIEDTDGFEEHRVELKAFRLEREGVWQRQREEELLALAETLGVPGNTKLAAAWFVMRRQIETLEQRIEAVSERCEEGRRKSSTSKPSQRVLSTGSRKHTEIKLAC